MKSVFGFRVRLGNPDFDFENLNPDFPIERDLSRGDWLGNPANIKIENNGAAGYVGSSLTVHNPLFSRSVHKL